MQPVQKVLELRSLSSHGAVLWEVQGTEGEVGAMVYVPWALPLDPQTANRARWGAGWRRAAPSEAGSGFMPKLDTGLQNPQMGDTSEVRGTSIWCLHPCGLEELSCPFTDEKTEARGGPLIGN